MVDSIASMSMSMSAARLQQSVSLAMVKETMQTQEMAMQNLVNTISSATEGLHIDTYA